MTRCARSSSWDTLCTPARGSRTASLASASLSPQVTRQLLSASLFTGHLLMPGDVSLTLLIFPMHSAHCLRCKLRGQP